jgi:cytochrome c-type biogenesis protein CcmH
MNEDQKPSRAASRFSPSRLVLAGAALLAVTAVGVKAWQSRQSDAPVTAAGEEQPDVSVMISRLEAKLKKDPNDAEGWRMLGWSLYGTEKYAEAAQAYRRASQLAPNVAENWSALGEALVLAAGDKLPPDAIDAFKKALAIDPKDSRARYFSAMAKDQAKDHKGAIDDFLALLKDTPAGAPWEANVRSLVTEIGKREGIKVDDRLAAITPLAAPVGSGVQAATAAIPGPSTAQMREASSMPKGQQDAMIQGMVDGLDAKLKANPKNVNGWIMLMRSRTQLGETGKAAKALADARLALAGDTAALGQLSEAADALGMK